MNLRLPIATLLLASCCVLAADECSAQRHPARVSRRRQAPPVPTSHSSLAPRSLVRLVQATDLDVDNDLDDVLDSARDLLERLDEDNPDSDLDPQPASELPPGSGSEAPKLPRTLDEYRKQKQQSALDNLKKSLDEEDEEGDGFDLNSLDDDEEDEEADDEKELSSRYQDVTPRPAPRRRARANMPATLGAILDDDEIDPACEQEFCRIMWQCAGGRCLSWCDRMKRNMDRDKMLKNACANPGCLRGPFDEPYICPKLQQPQDYTPYVEPVVDACPPADGYGESEYMYDGEQYNGFDQYDGGYVPGSDDYEVAPTEMDHSGDAMELAPVPDDSISRRRSSSRR